MTASSRPRGALKVLAVSLTKIANDLRFMGSGPRAGLAEIALPELQKGSSIMPGKVNPVIPEVVTQVAAQVIGNDQAITVGGMQGHFELNVFVPLLARNLLDSIKLLASASRLFAEKCVDGIEANRETCEHYAELTLSAATALNPYIGYDKAAEIVKEAASSGRSLREVARDAGVDEATLDEALDYRKMAKPHDRGRLASCVGRAPAGARRACGSGSTPNASPIGELAKLVLQPSDLRGLERFANAREVSSEQSSVLKGDPLVRQATRLGRSLAPGPRAATDRSCSPRR